MARLTWGTRDNGIDVRFEELARGYVVLAFEAGLVR